MNNLQFVPKNNWKKNNKNKKKLFNKIKEKIQLKKNFEERKKNSENKNWLYILKEILSDLVVVKEKNDEKYQTVKKKLNFQKELKL